MSAMGRHLPSSHQPDVERQSSHNDETKIAMWLPSRQNPNQQTEDPNVRRINSRISDQPAVSIQHSDDMRRANSKQSDQMGIIQPPIFHQKPQVVPQTKSQRGADNTSVRSGQDAPLNLNQTASSLATFVDDGRSVLTTTTLVSSNRHDVNNRTAVPQNG